VSCLIQNCSSDENQSNVKKDVEQILSLVFYAFFLFFLLFFLYSSVVGLEYKYSCKCLALWPDVFLYRRRYSIVNVQVQVFPLI